MKINEWNENEMERAGADETEPMYLQMTTADNICRI